jgi:type II secretory ATPase GspE/PulE/Tfp pilus assembly ATPase PilB-like protein
MGCEQCAGTGYRGRVGIYEMLCFDDTIRTMVREGATSVQIIQAARKNDFMLMREDGILKVLRGKTTMEELFQVVD